MTKKKLNQTSKVAYLLITFTLFVTTNWYLSDLILEQVISGEAFSNQYFALNYVKNTGAAFSIMQNSPYLLIGVSSIALVALFTYIIKYSKTMSMLGIFWLSLFMSGIFCNLYERVAYGYVRDFFELLFINFPVFNISDIYINVGVFGVIILILKRTQLRRL